MRAITNFNEADRGALEHDLEAALSGEVRFAPAAVRYTPTTLPIIASRRSAW